MKYIIDRIVGEKATLEDKNKGRIVVDLRLLPENVSEGDCVDNTENGFVKCDDETKKRKSIINSLKNKLFK